MKLINGLIAGGEGKVLTQESDLTFRRLDEAEAILSAADVSYKREWVEVEDEHGSEKMDVVQVFGVSWDELEDIILSGYEQLGILD